jgi:DNA polymerase-3 subunit delta'
MWSVIGHAEALAALDRAVESLRPAHAWLFTGPDGVGKRAVAIEFAAALNCTATLSERPCGVCRPCRDTLAGQHTDVELVAPGGICDEPDHRDHSDSRDLRICQIRRLERVLSLSPYAGGRRVAIIESADSLHVEAANAFLKTLEEPPPGTVIVLLAEREELLPETVLSRCQRLVFRPFDHATLYASLIERGADPSDAETIAAAAEGRIGWALRALEDPSLLNERYAMLDEAVRLAHAGRAERFAWAKEAESRSPERRERYLRELELWEGWWRDILQAGAGPSDGFRHNDRAAVLAEEGKLYSAGEVIHFLKALRKTREHLGVNVDPQLALENLMLDLPRPTPARRA